MRVIREMLSDIESKTFDFGFVGEKNHTCVMINCVSMFKQYPDAVATLVAKPPVGDIYPVVLHRDGVFVVWNVSESDIANDGSGQYQLTFTDGEGDNAEIIKTVYGSFSVKPSMVSNGEPPEPIEDWLEEANEALAEFGKINELSASATTLATGSEATAEVTTVDGHKNIAIGVPKGDKGDKGDPGDTGATPQLSIGTVTTLQPSQDATVTITGTDEEPVLNFGIPQGASGNETIDDTAGIGDTDLVWSANKSATVVGDLKSALSAIANVGTAEYSVYGYHNLYYNLVSGKQYTVSVTSSNQEAAVIINTPSTQAIITVYQGQPQVFTASSDVEYLKLYFNKSTLTTFRIEELGTRITTIESNIDTIEGNIDGIESDIDFIENELNELTYSISASYTAGGFHSLAYPVKSGITYHAKNESASTHIQIYGSADGTTQGALLQTVNAGTNEDFTPGIDYSYLMIYCNSAVLVKVTICQSNLVLDRLTKLENAEKANSTVGYEIWINQTNNWFDKAHIEVGSSGYYYSNYIPVAPGDVVEMSYYSGVNINLWDQFASLPPAYWYLYDDKKDKISREGTYINPFTIPNGVKYVRAYFYTTDIDANTYLIKKNELNKLYLPYSEPYPIYIQNDDKILVPSNIYTAVNQEMNIYYRNFIRNGKYSEFERIWIEPYGSEMFADRYIWNPSSASVKNVNIYGIKESSYTPILLSKTTINAVATHSQAAKTVLVIGDSKIDNGQPTGFLKQLYSGDLTLIGTRYGNSNTGDTSNRHEGRSGWSTKNYAMDANDGNTTNPFYNASYTNPTYGTHFDFATYMSNNGYTGVDVVFIMLGTNDSADLMRNGNLNPYKVNIDYLKGMIDSIKAYALSISSTIDIVIGLNEGVYIPKEEWHDRNYQFLLYNEEKIKAFDNRQNENIYVLGQYLDIDLINDYDVTNVPLSQADGVLNTGKTRPYTADGIHQNSVGYYKFAQCMDGILEYLSE